MKHLILIVFLFLLCECVFAQGGAPGSIVSLTAAELPAAASAKNKIYRVTDASNAGSCTGGGSTSAYCWSDGTSWTVIPAGFVQTSRQVGTTSPITGGGDLTTDRTIAVNNAAADGSTKGAASFTANDFDASSGNVSLDYTNGQAASSSNNGFLSSANWTTFNAKESALTFSTGLTRSTNTITVNTSQNIATLSNLTTNGFVKTSGGAGTLSVDTTTYLSGTLARANVDSTVLGIGTVSTASVNGTAATDVQMLELTLPLGYLNRSNGLIDVIANGTWTTGTTQTPTQNFKIKLCTISGCGSGTVLTLLTMTSAAATASTTETWIVNGTVGTVSTGASGTLIAHGFADLPVGANANTAFAGFHDVNTAATAGIDLTAQLFLDVTWQVSTQSGTKNSCIAHSASVKPRD